MSRIAAALLVALAFATSADAQEASAFLSIYASLGIDDLDADLPPSAELRFTVSLSDRFALEPFVTVGSQANRSVGPEGFYGAQIRQRIVRLTGESGYAYVTYGVAAYYSKYGSLAPVIGQFGVGLRRRLSGQVGFRPEVQLVTFHVVPIGVRFLAGLSVDLGR